MSSSLQDLCQVIEQREKEHLYETYYIKALYG